MGWTGRTIEGPIWPSQILRDSMIDECHDYTVYGHLTPSFKWYFGMTKQLPERRWGHNGARYVGSYFYNTIDKYGWNNIIHYIVATGLTKEEACILERNLIAEYSTMNRDRGYNRTAGGDTGILGYKFSDEQRQHLSQVHMGHKPANGFVKGHAPWNKGGGYYSPESRKRMSDSAKGRHASEATRRKLSIAHSGERHWNYGNHYTDEFKKKLSESHKGLPSLNKKPVWCIETGQFFFSATEAAAFYDLNSDAVSRVCRHERGTAAGLHWSYVDEPFVMPTTRPKRKSIVCIETGEVFASAVDAAKKLGVTGNAINNAARDSNKKSCGYHWQYVSDMDIGVLATKRKIGKSRKHSLTKQARGQEPLF